MTIRYQWFFLFCSFRVLSLRAWHAEPPRVTGYLYGNECEHGLLIERYGYGIFYEPGGLCICG